MGYNAAVDHYEIILRVSMCVKLLKQLKLSHAPPECEMEMMGKRKNGMIR